MFAATFTFSQGWGGYLYCCLGETRCHKSFSSHYWHPWQWRRVLIHWSHLWLPLHRSFKNRRDHWAALPVIGAFQGWRAHSSFRVVYLWAFLEGCVSGRQSFAECLVNTFRVSARQFDYVRRCETCLPHTVSSFPLTESHLFMIIIIIIILIIFYLYSAF